jgi:octaprenyl-diphosphate synthase
MRKDILLDIIYKPVQKDLETVEDLLRSIARVDYVKLAELLDYSFRDSGKRIRPALVLLSGKFYEYNLNTLLPMAVAVELLHTATLIHDDAIDSSAVRRGKPTINVTWSDDKAILLGDYLFAKAEEFTSRTENIRVIRLCAQTLQIITSGELDQAFNAFNINQTYEAYIARIASKTASLLSTTTESGAVLGNAPEKSIRILKDYGYNLGISFQIVDDILDFAGTEKELGKPVGSDLAQGTLTLPAMLLIEKYPDDNPVRKIFENPEHKENINRAVEMIQNSDIVDKCFKVAIDFKTKACSELNELPSNNRQYLIELANFVVARRT